MNRALRSANIPLFTTIRQPLQSENNGGTHERTALPRPPLRVGIMLDSFTVTQWVSKVIRDIDTSPFAELALIILNAAPHRQEKRTLPKRLKAYWTHSVFERYRRWDRQRNACAEDAFAPADISESLKNVPLLRAIPIQTKFVDRFAAQDIETIRDQNLDVLFRFGFRIIRGDILACARYGVWSFHHGDHREYRGAPPGFWEM